LQHFCRIWRQFFSKFVISLEIFVGMILLFPLVVTTFLVRHTSAVPTLYWSDWVGRHNEIFKMPKFRSMQVGVPAMATHLLADPNAQLTPIEPFLRKSSLDELPQLWSILAGDTSFIEIM
jgi:O-antigen biosynthesis protein WbqP